MLSRAARLTIPGLVGLILLALSSPTTSAKDLDRRVLRTVGEATIGVAPDQAHITLGVQTVARTAQEASSQNAAKLEVVIRTLRELLGPDADLKTASYVLTPNYNTYASPGSAPIMTGYTAFHSIEVITRQLNVVGQILDTAAQAGVNRVDNLSFSLIDDRPVRSQALQVAVTRARTQAEAIATGLGLRLGPVITAQEGAAYASPAQVSGRQIGAITPVQPGSVLVSATVTLDFAVAK